MTSRPGIASAILAAALCVVAAGCSSSGSTASIKSGTSSATNANPSSYTPTELPIGKPFCVQGTVLYAGNTPYLVANSEYTSWVYEPNASCPSFPAQSEMPTTQFFIVTRTGPHTFVSTKDGAPAPTTDPEDSSQRWYDLQPLSSVKPSPEALDQLYAVSTLTHLLAPGQQRYISLADVDDAQDHFEILGDTPTSPKLYGYKDVGNDMAGISVTRQGRLQLCMPVGDTEGLGLTTHTVAPGIVKDVGPDYLPGGLYYPIVRTDGQGCRLPQIVPMPSSFEVTSLAPGQSGFGDCGFYRTPSGKTFYQIYGDPYMGYIEDDQPLSSVPLPSAASGPGIVTEVASVLYRNPITHTISALVAPTCPIQTNLYLLVVQK